MGTFGRMFLMSAAFCRNLFVRTDRRGFETMGFSALALARIEETRALDMLSMGCRRCDAPKCASWGLGSSCVQ